ncbi:MAG: RNA polymerase sigma factor [Pseudomonadota bacterium]
MSRNKNAYKEIAGGIEALFPRLWRYCLALTSNPDRANDLAQSTCLRALEKHALYEPGTKLDRWIFRMAQRLWINEMRADAVRQGGGLLTLDEIDLPDKKPGQETNLMARQLLMEVMRLPEAQRVTVMLVYVEGFSYKEAAGILDIPIGTVMSRLASSRAKLAAKFDGAPENGGKVNDGN